MFWKSETQKDTKCFQNHPDYMIRNVLNIRRVTYILCVKSAYVLRIDKMDINRPL